MTYEEVDGTKIWYGDLNHKYHPHRLDGPAVICANGDQIWYQHGREHRLDGPAIERVSGRKEWYVKGKLHRLDGPAIIDPDIGEEWYQDGVYHRDNEQPCVINPRHKIWVWHRFGKLHRTDGPAIITQDPAFQAYYINGRLFDSLDYQSAVDKWLSIKEYTLEEISTILNCDFKIVNW